MDRAAWWAQFMGTLRVGHDCVTQQSLSQTCLKAGIPYELLNFKMPNRRKENKKIQKLLLKMNSQQKLKQNNKKGNLENPNEVDS